jgi:hypothetical protein
MHLEGSPIACAQPGDRGEGWRGDPSGHVITGMGLKVGHCIRKAHWGDLSKAEPSGVS